MTGIAAQTTGAVVGFVETPLDARNVLINKTDNTKEKLVQQEKLSSTSGAETHNIQLNAIEQNHTSQENECDSASAQEKPLISETRSKLFGLSEASI